MDQAECGEKRADPYVSPPELNSELLVAPCLWKELQSKVGHELLTLPIAFTFNIVDSPERVSRMMLGVLGNMRRRRHPLSKSTYSAQNRSVAGRNFASSR